MAIQKAKYYFKELTTLSVGIMWHILTIIGRLAVYKKIQVENKTQEAIKLVYADNDIVYVSIHSLHKISNTTVKTVRHLKFIS
jgi:transcription-repair coupling factor (superfamily II helicase)